MIIIDDCGDQNDKIATIGIHVGFEARNNFYTTTMATGIKFNIETKVLKFYSSSSIISNFISASA